MQLLELTLVFIVLAACSAMMFYFIRNHINPDFQKLYKDKDGIDPKFDDDLLKSRPSSNYRDFLANKWLAFGGGFYGLVAVLTYIIVEAQEVIALFTMPENATDVFTGFSIGMLISLFINFLIDSILNFVTAISWPVFWMNVGNAPFWQSFMVAYGGYLTGKALVKTYYPFNK